MDKDLTEIDYKKVQELLVQPKWLKIVDKGNKLTIFSFVVKFVSRIYIICMINTWLSKKKGSTLFDLMTMSDIPYTVVVLENSYEVWDQEYKNVLSRKRSKDWKTKSGASSMSRSGTLEGTLCL